MIVTILNFWGYFLFAYITIVVWLADVRGGTWWQRLKYFMSNFSWRFWVLLAVAIFCVSIK